MKKQSIAKVVSAISLAAICAFGAFAITGCSSEAEESIPDELQSDTGLTGGVAATVNGVEIDEDKVTRAINNMRINYGYTEEDKWKEYLKNRKYTSESMRYEVLGEFIDQELVKQCAEQLGATTDDEEIQSYVDKMSEQYSSEEAWLKAVDDAGWDDGVEGYKKALNFSILEKKLKDHFKEEEEARLADDAAMVEQMKEAATTYDGAKKTSHILFSSDDEELANEVYEKLQSGEITFEDAVTEYSTDDTTKENGGDVGWDKVNSFVAEYTDAINNLQEVGDISEPTKSKYGYHIVELTEVWTQPEEITSVNDMPEEFVEKIRTSAVDTNSETNYKDWLDDQHPENQIEVNPMPEGVPYYVDMSDEYTEEEADDINKKALDKLIEGTVEEEADTTAAETAAAEGDDAAAAAAEGAADATAEDTDVTDAAEDAAAAAETDAQLEEEGAASAEGEEASN